MRKQLMVLVVLLILTGASVSALFVYQEDVRSETQILYGSMHKSDYDAVVRIGDSNYRNVSIQSDYYNITRGYEDASICYIQLEVMVNENYVFETFELHYRYVCDGSSLIPRDAAPDQDRGSGVSRQYIDPVTGDTLLFRESEGVLQSVRFTGTAIIGDDGDFEYADFDMVVEYDPDVTYVNSIETAEPNQSMRIDIAGTENGMAMSGSVETDALFRIVSPLDYETAEVNVSISGTSIPPELLSYVTTVSDKVVYQNNILLPYLRQDGMYVDPYIQYRYGSAEDGSTVFSMSGTVTTYQLDADCNVISQETIEFSYGVVR